MLKQPSSRNHRSKGFKVKHAVQVFVLAAVCVWLLYQVKHSHDKKVAMEERSNKLAGSTVGEDEGGVSSGGNILKLGRKDLPNVHLETGGGGGGDDSHEEEDGADETEEAEHEEDTKPEESEEEEDGRGAGDDEIDENDQERGDEEAEQREELAEEDEEKERRERDESGLLASNDHDLDREHAEANSQEAREVHYKEDDASSAVVKENETSVESEVEHTGGEGSEVGHTENGEEKHEENRERTENGEARQRADGQHEENGEERHGENGEERHGENGEARQRADGQHEENGEEKHGENGERAENGEARQTEDGQQTENGGQITEWERKDTREATRGGEAGGKNPVEQLGGTSTNGTGTILLEQSDQQVGDAGSANSTLVGSNDQQAESTVEVSSNSTLARDANSSENSTVAIDTKDVGLQLQDETVALGLSTDQNSTTDTQTAVHPGSDSTEEKAHEEGPKQEQIVTEGSEKTAEGQQQEETAEGQQQEESSEDVLQAAKPDAVTDEEKDARTDLSTLPEMQTDTRSVEDIAAE